MLFRSSPVHLHGLSGGERPLAQVLSAPGSRRPGDGFIHAEIHGPAVAAVHRLLKNQVVAQIGPRPYLLITDVAAEHLGLSDEGLRHHEDYPDSGRIEGRIIGLK